MLKQSVDGDAMVVCDQCDEAVPRSHSVLREGPVRLCWMCYTDEIIGHGSNGDDDWVDDDDDVDWDDVWGD